MAQPLDRAVPGDPPSKQQCHQGDHHEGADQHRPVSRTEAQEPAFCRHPTKNTLIHQRPLLGTCCIGVSNLQKGSTSDLQKGSTSQPRTIRNMAFSKTPAAPRRSPLNLLGGHNVQGIVAMGFL
jgi:hypothetical protein